MKAIFFLIIPILILSSCGNNSKTKDDISKMSISEISILLKTDSTNAQLYQIRAERFYKLNQLDSALADYKIAVKYDGNQLDWLTKLSDLYLFKGQSEKARQTLDEALKLNPNNTETLLKMGMLYLLIEDHLKSFEYINQALSIDPNMEKAYFYKSMNYIEVGDTTRAIDELLKAVEKNPEYIDAYIQLGLFSDAINDTIARVYYKNAIKIDSTNAFAHYDLALHYQHQEEFNKAIRQYLYLTEHIDSTFSTAYHNIGYIYLIYSDDLDTAISYFNKAIEIDYNYAEAYANKAYALELQKKYKASYVEYQTAIKLNPDLSIALKGAKRVAKQLNLKLDNN